MNWKNIVIYPLALLGMGTIVYLIVNANNTSTTNVTQVLPSPTMIVPTIVPTETPKTSLDLPKNDKWVKYVSKCVGLLGINIYYPSSWKLGKMGEDKISDGYDSTSEGKKQYDSQCLIQFGYPVAPNGRQDMWANGMNGEVIIQAENWLPDFDSQADKNTVAIYTQKINGRNWNVLEDNSGDIYWTIHNGQKFYKIMFWHGEGVENLNAVSLGYIKQTVGEFVQKVQFK